MKKVGLKISIVFIFFVSIVSCLKPVQYPDEPAVEFVQFDIHGDSGIITFYFTDGDGDIGLNANQIFSRLNLIIDNVFKSPDDIIQFNDPNLNKIIIKANTEIPVPNQNKIMYPKQSK